MMLNNPAVDGTGQNPRGQHVLVIEQDRAITMLLEMVLEEEGYRVTCARHGAEGLLLMRATLHPLVVVLDGILPDMSAEEFLSAVRTDQTLEAFAIVLFTARHGLASSLRSDFADLVRWALPYPFDMNEMMAMVGGAAASLRERA